jgi:hypothetical protein
MNLYKFAPVLLAMALAAGCAAHHAHPKTTPPPAVQPTASAPIITLDSSLSARVVSYNQAAEYVVLGFPSNQLPKIGDTLFLYRNGLKTAQLKVTGPASENNIVADVLTGDVQVGDEVRNQ